MNPLSYIQKKTLVAYEMFFGNRYVPNKTSDNNDLHVETEKMCYLLKMAGVEIGDYGFTWDIQGPYSPGLLASLQSLDRLSIETQNFYDSNPDARKYISGEYHDDVQNLSEMLEIKQHKNQQVRWVELLGSLTYIGRTIYFGEKFDIVNRKLMQEKSYFTDKSMNNHAWDLLICAKLL